MSGIKEPLSQKGTCGKREVINRGVRGKGVMGVGEGEREYLVVGGQEEHKKGKSGETMQDLRQ